MPWQAPELTSTGSDACKWHETCAFPGRTTLNMRSWFNRLVLALVAVSVMQAGIVACCGNTDDLNPGNRQHSPHDPCEPQPCCSPSLVVQAVVPQLLIRWERPSLVNSGVAVTPTSGQNSRTVALCAALANRHNTVPLDSGRFARPNPGLHYLAALLSSC